jgi:hypothetical protein
MLIATIVMSVDDQMFLRCVGRTLAGGGRGGSLIRMVAAVPCSPYYLSGQPIHYLVFAGLWAPIPFAVMQVLWMRRHKMYWDGVRAREKVKRAERRTGMPMSEVDQSGETPD